MSHTWHVVGFCAGLVLLAFLFLLLGLIVIDQNTSWLPRWFCDHMDWHKPPLKVGFDGCSMNGRCPRCNRLVLADSNGDYFASARQDS